MGEGGQTIEEPQGGQKPAIHGPKIVISHNKDGTVDLGIVKTDPQGVYRVLAENNPEGWGGKLVDILKRIVTKGTSVHSPEEPKPE